MVIRERWAATGRDSEPLYTRERAGLGDDTQMLRLFAATDVLDTRLGSGSPLSSPSWSRIVEVVGWPG